MGERPPAVRVLNTPTLSREAVTLRQLTRADVEALAAAAAEGRAGYRFNLVPDGLAATDAYVDKALAQQSAGLRMPFVVLWHGRVVGTSSYSELQPWEWYDETPLRRTDQPDAVEVGYTWLAASAQRTVVNTTAKYLLFAHAFEVWDVHSVTLRTDARNERSRRPT